MIDFYYWPTPNGWKVSIMLEECGLQYKVIPVNISNGDQFSSEFLALSPNNRIPAIVDHHPPSHYTERPIQIFESGAILLYLAKKKNLLFPQKPEEEKEVLEWLYWQVGNLGPMAGQLSHFINYADGVHPYATTRYANEYNRCLGVLERRLEGRQWLAGTEYSIADIASWPWVLIAKPLGQSLDIFPNVTRWRQKIKKRAAVQKGVDLGKKLRRTASPSEEERELLYKQTADSINFFQKKADRPN